MALTSDLRAPTLPPSAHLSSLAQRSRAPMPAPKIKWTAAYAPTGAYRSFVQRGWPHASYANERRDPCGDIRCADEYVPARVRSGQHAPLTLRVADHSVKPWKWITLTGTHPTLPEAKAALDAYLASNPGVRPAQYRAQASADCNDTAIPG